MNLPSGAYVPPDNHVVIIMAENRSGSGLQTLFAVFLGLMVTAFVGVGVYTFHPGPFVELNQQIEALNREQEAIRNSKLDADLTTEDRARLQDLTDRTNALLDQRRVRSTDWGRSTSVILVILATVVMAFSLVKSGELPVLSNGLLIGGVLTMVYGVGWIIFSEDTSATRFIVMTVALVMTVGLGYLRFVRGRAAAADGRGVATGDLGEIESRVAALEKRLDEASAALGARS